MSAILTTRASGGLPGAGHELTGGCRCEDCIGAAPHGTLDRLEQECYCPSCVSAAEDSGLYRRAETTVLVDAATGATIDGARVVSTRYGTRWVVDRADGGADWYPHAPARRSTMVNKGVLEAPAEHLVRQFRNGGCKPVARLANPTVDAWGEPIKSS